MSIKSFRDLIVWQKAKELAIEIYKITRNFPQSEMFGLASQMQRAAVSISSNIAEGYHKPSKKDKDRFFSMAYGSGSELESQIEIAKELYSALEYQKAENILTEIQKILNKFLHS